MISFKKFISLAPTVSVDKILSETSDAYDPFDVDKYRDLAQKIDDEDGEAIEDDIETQDQEQQKHLEKEILTQMRKRSPEHELLSAEDEVVIFQGLEQGYADITKHLCNYGVAVHQIIDIARGIKAATFAQEVKHDQRIDRKQRRLDRDMYLKHLPSRLSKLQSLAKQGDDAYIRVSFATDKNVDMYKQRMSDITNEITSLVQDLHLRDFRLKKVAEAIVKKNLELTKLAEGAENRSKLRTEEGKCWMNAQEFSDSVQELDYELKRVNKLYDKLVLSNERLVGWTIARVSDFADRQKKGINLQDLVSAGMEGLQIAAERFNYKHEKGGTKSANIRFSTYAYHWVSQRVSVANKDRIVKISAYALKQISVILHARDEIIEKFGQLSTEEMYQKISQATGFPVNSIEALIALSYRAQSMDKPIDDESNATVADNIEDMLATRTADTYDMGVIVKKLQALKDSLTPRELALVDKFYNTDENYNTTLQKYKEHIKATRVKLLAS